jgi:hypothetical protein
MREILVMKWCAIIALKYTARKSLERSCMVG